jgi:hypothetical protein
MQNSPYDNNGYDSDYDMFISPDASPKRTSTAEIRIPVPYATHSCAICLQQSKGDFVLLNLNNALRHAENHHQGVAVVFPCTKCGKALQTKHSAQCHVPKCKGPTVKDDLTKICSACNRAFATERGLSQHERFAHPEIRNEKRQRAATGNEGAELTKCYGKTWSKEEVDTMMRLELSLRGHPTISRQMTEHLPNKTTKQIRDKRREKTYKALIGALTRADDQPAAPELQTECGTHPRTRTQISCPISGSKGDPNPITSAPNLTHPTAHDPLCLDILVGAELGVGNDDQTTPPTTEVVAGGASDDDKDWQLGVICQALTDSRPTSAMADKYKDLHTQLIARLTDIKENPGLISQTLLDDTYEQILKEITASCTEKVVSRKRVHGPARKRKKKRYHYARTQDLFRKNPNLLAKYIRQNTKWIEDQEHSSPAPEEAQTFYGTLWGAPSNIRLPFSVTNSDRTKLEMNEVLQTITLRDVKERINRLRQNTAPGLDGIKKNHIAELSMHEILRILFNMTMASKLQPAAWNTNKTILIPKEGKDRSKIENYRPLTISSLICRAYWGIIDQKLRGVTSFSPRQKGFVHEAGCFNNVHLLNEVIKASKKEQGLTAVQLDITKAFDTVPHEAIDAALQNLGLPKGLRESIMNSYKGLRTTIQCNKTQIEIPLMRGVKQGDPLSPYIFNAILNPLIEQLEDMKGVTIDNTNSLSALAFADDLILLATTKDKAKQLLHHTENYLHGLGMKLAADKCASFEIVPIHKSWYLEDPHIQLQSGEKITASKSTDHLRYLGGNVSPWFGLQYADIVENLRTTLERCRCALLKPHQKLSLITNHILPHFIHEAVLATPPTSTIRAMDQEIRKSIKLILHLPMSTPNGLLYCRKKDGGLGIPRLETLVICCALKQGILLLNSLDPTTHALMEKTELETRLASMAKAKRLSWPALNFGDIERFKRLQKDLELKTWSELKSKGRGVTSFVDDKFGNAWIYHPSLLKPSRFLTALKLRGGVTSDRVTLNKITPLTSVKCRKCKVQTETLAHILGQCTYTKAQRIKRHDEIRDIVAHKLTKGKGVKIIEEAAIASPKGSYLKPDLVVVSQGRVHVVDVTIRHEDTGYLEMGYKSKIEKYTPLLDVLAEQLEAERGRVLPLVVGTRGSLPKSAIDTLEELDIKDRSTYITITLTALRHSIEIYHSFMDYNVLAT